MSRLRLFRWACVTVLGMGLVGSTLPVHVGAAEPDFVYERFERYLDSLRRQAGIPGLAAAVLADQEVIWEAGLGFADVERSLPATPDTPFFLGHLSGPVGATVLLRCVEARTVELDAPLTRFRPGSDPGVTLRHVLTHTAPDQPERFVHNPDRYALLTPAIETCSGQSYRAALATQILSRLGMIDSAPGQIFEPELAAPTGPFDPADLERYAAVVQRLATPYRVERRNRATPSAYPLRHIDAATGLIASLRDLARFEAAMEDHALVGEDLLEAAWALPPVIAPAASGRPHGLGWFVQVYNGERIVWQYNHTPDAASALVLKVPRRGLTFLLLANSDGLSDTFPLQEGDVSVSIFARLFLNVFL